MQAQQAKFKELRTASARRDEARANLHADHDGLEAEMPAQIAQAIHEYKSSVHFTGALKVLLGSILSLGYTLSMNQAKDQCPQPIIENLQHGRLYEPGCSQIYKARLKEFPVGEDLIVKYGRRLAAQQASASSTQHFDTPSDQHQQ